MYVPRRMLVLFGLLALIPLGVLSVQATPRLQDSPDGPAAPSAQLGTAFTYQGTLEESGSPANGTYDLRIILYDALSGGAQVGSTVTVDDVAVADGRFTVALDFGSIFDGTAVWLEIGVRPGAESGTYTILSPRQPLTAAPSALGLRPGATIKQTAAEAALHLESASHGLLVPRSENNAIRVESTGNAALHVSDADQDAIHINNAGLDGIDINNAAIDGVQVDNAGRHGVRVGNASSDGFRVGDAGNHGLRVRSAISNGIQIDHADNNGIFICSTGSESSCQETSWRNGLEIGRTSGSGIHIDVADDYGMYVGSAYSGVRVNSAEYNGLRVSSADFYGTLVNDTGKAGFRVDNPGTNGLYVYDAGDSGVWVRDATNYAGYFDGNVFVDGSCSGCLLAMFGINKGSSALKPGDIVSGQGIAVSQAENVSMLVKVASAQAGGPLVGVVSGGASLHTSEEDGSVVLVPRDGEPAGPGEYVTVITYGPVEVPAATTVALGDKVTVDGGGTIRSLKTVEFEGVQLAESAPSLGVALEAGNSDGNGRVWVLVNPR